jgi:hypothetical protein
VSDNWIARWRPTARVAAVMAAIPVWVPQAPAAAGTSGAFVSQWDGPIVSRQFQFQSVAKPVGLPVADPVAETPFGWRAQYATPERKLPRAHLAESVSRPLGALETVQVAWQSPLAAPTVRVSRTHLANGVAWAPQIITAPAGATAPSDWWGDKYSQPTYPPTRVALLNGYVKPWHQPANPTASSGAFTSSWDGPIFSRQFQYQSKIAPVSAPLVFLAAQSAWDGPYFFKAFLYEEMAAFVKAPDAVAGATTPSELGWQLQYSGQPKKRYAQQFWTAWAAVEAPAVTPSVLGWQLAYSVPQRRARGDAGSVAPVFVPVTSTWGWHGAFVQPRARQQFADRGSVSFTFGQVEAPAVTPSQLAFWSLFGGKPAAKLATPWFYPSDFYTVGQTDGGSTPPLVEELHAIEFIGTVGKLLTR